MHVGRGLLSAVCLLTAPILLLQGYANAQMAPGIPGWNGFWEAAVARGFVQAEQENEQLTVSVGEAGVALAEDAWKKEPLATDALAVFAASERAQGNDAALSALLERAGSLEKRNRFIGALELEQAIRSGDLDQAFALVDQLSRANPRFMSSFVAPLTSVLTEEGSVSMLRGVLEERPVWAPTFWGRIPDDPSAVERMYELRRQEDFGTSKQTDAQLLSSLADAQLYEQVFAFWRTIEPGSDNPTAFSNGVDFPPVEWRLASIGERSLSFRHDGAFEIYVERQTFGELARQLVQLSPGSYLFTARISPSDEAGNVEVSLICASDDEEALDPQSLDAPARWSIDGTCETHWLVLSGTAWDRARPLRANISDMVLRRP